MQNDNGVLIVWSISKLGWYLKSILRVPIEIHRQSAAIAKILERIEAMEAKNRLAEAINARIGQVAGPGDAEVGGVDRRLQVLLSQDADAKAAVDVMCRSIDTELKEADRPHARNHLVRYLTTYSLVPRGPGTLLDIAWSPTYTAALRDLKAWSIEKVPILAFDYEKDPLPFADSSMDGVLLCEVIEHFVCDPVFCLIEINRVVKPGGFLLLSTPNVTSWFAIYRLLAHKHPYRWSVYAYGHDNAKNHIHAREYVPDEIRQLMEASGFEVIKLTTVDYGISAEYPKLIEADACERGETIFCLGRKKSRPVMRTYTPLYLSDSEFKGF